MPQPNLEPRFTEHSDWKGVEYISEIYGSTDFSNLSPITQVQAVCFSDENHIVLYRHIDGWFGLPGGHIDPGENIEQTLKREIEEEIAGELVEYGPICYLKIWRTQKPDKITYNLRYWAKVNLPDKPVQDPCGKALERMIVPTDEAIQKLNWGKKGKILISLAVNRFKSKSHTD